MDKNEHIAELRKNYISNPPDGMSSHDVKDMSNNDLLDMHYFLTDDDFDSDDDFEEGFYIL